MGQQITVSEANYALLTELAQRQGKTIDDVVAELLVDLRQDIADQRAFWGKQFDQPLPEQTAGQSLDESGLDALG